MVSIHLACTFAMTGAIWVVQLVVYPGFRLVSSADFGVLHRHEMRRIAPLVIPLMLAELLTGVMLYVRHDPWLPPKMQIGLLALLSVAWVGTFGLSIPCHRKLEQEGNARLLERLILTNWVRTGAWTARTFIILAAMLGGLYFPP